MAFNQKTWKDRVTEYPSRRTLTKTDGSTEIVNVARSEGTVSEEGDAFSAKNMNDLEQRISDTFGGFSFYPQVLTQAEYDALSDEIKSTPKMLFVTKKEG